jgi:hypothetical protein
VEKLLSGVLYAVLRQLRDNNRTVARNIFCVVGGEVLQAGQILNLVSCEQSLDSKSVNKEAEEATALEAVTRQPVKIEQAENTYVCALLNC